MTRYEPDQYGRMLPKDSGTWVTFAESQQAILAALEAERTPKPGLKQYEVGYLMLGVKGKCGDPEPTGGDGE